MAEAISKEMGAPKDWSLNEQSQSSCNWERSKICFGR